MIEESELLLLLFVKEQTEMQHYQFYALPGWVCHQNTSYYVLH